MTRRAFRMAGQGPSVKWKRNRGRARRSIAEAVALAISHGVQIPPDVIFHKAEAGELAGSLKSLAAAGAIETARGPEIAEHPDGYVYWKDHYNRHGKIPVRLHPDVLTSDEAIVAVLRHEM